MATRAERRDLLLSGVRESSHEWSERADVAAVRHSEHPAYASAVLAGATVVLGVGGTAIGLLLSSDAAAYFREGMPGTWLSAAMLLAAAVTARAAFRRELPAARWHASFWGLSAAILTVLVVVELTQPTIFLGQWLEESSSVVAPFGITNVDAALLVVLLVAIVLALAPHALGLLRHPAALSLFALTMVFAGASQSLDSFWAVSEWEFVAEESLKALAEVFLVAGYLVALRDILGRH